MIKRNYKPRIFFVFLVFIVVSVLILIRLFFMQIYFGDFYKNLAHAQYSVNVKINPMRGLILDRNGFVIASNSEALSAYILPKQIKNNSSTYTALAEFFPDVYKRLTESNNRYFMWVERILSSQKKELIQNVLGEDIKLITEPYRYYPYPEMMNVLGMTNVDNVGISGLELAYDKVLRGARSEMLLEKDARFKHLYFDKCVNKEGAVGASLSTTLDVTLQYLVQEELKATICSLQAQEGSILVMDPDTGEVLVMANYPALEKQEYCSHSADLVKNRIVTECYELGSVLKIFATLAALEEGVVGFDEPIDSEGKVTYLNNFRVENWKSIGVEPFYEAVRRSSNVGVAKIALRLGSRLHHHLCRVGFGSKTGIEFPGERAGFVNHPKNWSRSSPIVLSFGYEVMSSILQLGTALSIVANGGYLVKPHLIKDAYKKDNKERLYREDAIDKVRQILTLIGQRYPVKSCAVMGKTGTARIAEQGGYSLTRHIYTFAGILEHKNFRRVIVTFIKEPVAQNLWAATCAAPLFQRVANLVMLQKVSHPEKR